MPIYSYIRFSLKRQIMGDSVRRQTALAENYCQRHGYVLDKSLTMRDLGVSAFRGKNYDIGALSLFLDACKSRKIPKNSTLICENLDRITRTETLDAVGVIASILNSGVAIVTLEPETVYTRENVADDIGKLMQLVMTLALANQESSKKSKRISSGWEQKRKDLKKAKKQARPGWIGVDADGVTFHLLPDYAKTIKQIFLWYSQGFGAILICQKLLENKAPCPARKGKWHIGYIQQILRNESVIGRYQPKKRDKETGEFLPVGDVIEDFYPAVITKELWNKCHNVKAKKPKRGSGRKNKENKSFNMFKGLMMDTRGSTVFLDNRHANRYPVIANTQGHKAQQAKPETFPYDSFEYGVLEALTELKNHQIQNESPEEDLTSKLKEQIAELDFAITETKKALAKKFSQNLLEIVEGYESTREQFVKELEMQTASTEKISLDETQTVIGAYRANPEANKTLLQTCIASIVKKLLINWENTGPWLRQVGVKIIFHNGQHREIKITHKRTTTKEPIVTFSFLFSDWSEIKEHVPEDILEKIMNRKHI